MNRGQLAVIVFAVITTMFATAMVMTYALKSTPPQGLQPVAAFGLNDEKQVWNRIRVDDLGHVICAKP